MFESVLCAARVILDEVAVVEVAKIRDRNFEKAVTGPASVTAVYGCTWCEVFL